MEENRLRVMQQQQIAEAIEDQKRRGGVASYPFEKERILLSHIRAGDQAGARRVLNEMLGAMYMTAPKLVVLRARAIELMGYLTRAAVEDSPIMESLIERNHQWMRRLISARDFEKLARVLTEALNDFIEGIYLHGFNRSNTHVSKALDFITQNYTKPLTLNDIAREVGLSSYRLAHVVKAHTGKTVLQIIAHARIQNAQHLLEHSGKSCTEIAYEVGFNDQSYFIKHFRRLTGITPARYRRTRMVRPRDS
jgi:two-component system response regulator YesN